MPRDLPSPPTVGIIGFGAFGQLMARHLRGHCHLYAHDPSLGRRAQGETAGVLLTGLPVVAACQIVILATPVRECEAVIAAIAPYLQPGALVLDVGSVKVLPAEVMQRCLPPDVDILATHPLFGPQSARHGLSGLKIALCPLRGRSWRRIAAFLRRVLGLSVIVTTPEAHDREAAMVQGLTHLIAKVLVQMEPLPSRMTTRSFDLLRQAVEMVRHDAPAVFEAIERDNPYAPVIRRRFFDLAAALDARLEGAVDGSAEADASPDIHLDVKSFLMQLG